MTTIHTYTTSEAGLSVNAFLVETARGVVAIDATLTNSDSLALKKLVQSTGKPLLAVLLTHGHPDHVAGVTNLVEDNNTPIISLASVKELMQRTEADKHAQWSGMFGQEWIRHWTYPNTLVKDGEAIQLDGLSYRVHDLGAGGDCDANSIWVLELGPSAAFVGDLVYNQYYTYMADGAILRWLANLERFRPLLSKHTLYMGHGKEGSVSLLDQQREYFLTYCSTLLKLTKGSAQLDEATTQQFVQQMEKAYPGYGLSFMIGLGASKVAQELANPSAVMVAAH
jgi:glyoxylase-like metal-dependent hydrolase (beta-lactamase superfamily II)